MKATCPKHPEHKEFITTAHVMQEWVVDEHGNFLNLEPGGESLEVVSDPDPNNCWYCKICGAEAEVEE